MRIMSACHERIDRACESYRMTIDRSRYDAGHMREIELASDGGLVHLLDLSRTLSHLFVRMTVLFQRVDAVLDLGTAQLGEEETGMNAADVHHR